MSAADAMKKRGVDFSKLNKLSAAAKGTSAGQEVLRVHHSECYSEKQVRVNFSAIESLSASMAKRQLQPCKVWPKDERGYRICIGERRWRAAAHGDLQLDIIVDPILADLSPAEVILYQLTENTQRENLTPKEEAQAVADMMDAGMSPGDIALAKSAIEQWSASSASSWVSRIRRLLSMPAPVEALHDGGLHDVEALNCLTAIHELDPAACKQLIDDGMTSRKAVRAALKAIKGGNSVPGNSTTSPVQLVSWGPEGLENSTYTVEVDRHSDGRYVAVVNIKLAGKELKASWLTDAALASEHIEDVKARVFTLVRDFMIAAQHACNEPSEQATYQLIIDYWKIVVGTRNEDEQPAALATNQGKAETQQQASTPATNQGKAETQQQAAAPATNQGKAETQQQAAAPATNQGKAETQQQAAAPAKMEGPRLIINGFLDEEPVILCLDEIVPGDFVVIMDIDGNRITVPTEDFTFGSITKA